MKIHDDNVMAEYYGRWAPLYDRMYQDISPDLRTPMLDDLFATVTDRQVLELASGTGFWSEWIAPYVAGLVGVDFAPEMIAVARSRPIAPGKVTFHEGNIYSLANLPATFTAGIAIQWFSHVPIARYQEFFSAFHSRLLPGARVFMADNIRQAEADEYEPLFQKPGSADTYELRTLPDGSKHEILKNYFTADQLTQILPPESSDVQVQLNKTWWWLTYRIG